MQEEEKERFFVETVLPASMVKRDPGMPHPPSRLLAQEAPAGPDDISVPQGVDPKLWQMLLVIDEKLDHILDRLSPADEGLTEADGKKIHLGPDMLRIESTDDFAVGDYVEIKLLVTLRRRYTAVFYGYVREREQTGGKAGLYTIVFSEISDDVKSALVQVSFDVQREMICRRKGDLF